MIPFAFFPLLWGCRRMSPRRSWMTRPRHPVSPGGPLYLCRLQYCWIQPPSAAGSPQIHSHNCKCGTRLFCQFLHGTSWYGRSHQRAAACKKATGQSMAGTSTNDKQQASAEHLTTFHPSLRNKTTSHHGQGPQRAPLTTDSATRVAGAPTRAIVRACKRW